MLDFDLSSYEKRVAPTGKYLVRVMGIPELKNTKDNNGRYLEVNFKVIDGFMIGHMLSRKFNLYNSNPTAERIAREHLLKLCKCGGLDNLKTYGQLEGLNVWANVSESFYKDTPQNEVDSFEKFDGVPMTPITPVEDKLNDEIPF
jgi:hypothetical protein